MKRGDDNHKPLKPHPHVHKHTDNKHRDVVRPHRLDPEELGRNHVAKQIGPIAKPRQILIVNELPKTRSGKIMRRLLKDVAEDRQVGDATTLADPNVMKLIAAGLQSAKDED